MQLSYADRGLVIASGSSAGFALTAFWEFARQVNWANALTLFGSVASTAVAIYIARRADLTRAEIDRQHQLRQARRDEDLADLLNRLKIREAEQDGAKAGR